MNSSRDPYWFFWGRTGRFLGVDSLKNVLVRDGGLIMEMCFQTQASEK
jgi:hypothetical protein